MNELLEELRDACTTVQWNEAVQLARHGAVTGEGRDEDEYILRVSKDKDKGKACYTVSLWPDYPDWNCECPDSGEACTHVAAAAIALNQAAKKGEELPSSYRDEASIGYRLTRQPQGLYFQRILNRKGVESPFGYSLVSLMNGDVEGPSVMATKGDLRVDGVLNYRMMSSAADPTILRADEPEILNALSDCRDLTLDGAPVRCSGDPIKPLLALVYHPEGAMLMLREREGVTETFPNGFALCEGVLRVLDKGGLNSKDLTELTAGRVFSQTQIPNLMSAIVPRLRRSLEVVIEHDGAPKVIKLSPVIRVATELRGSALSILATLVYGDPPIARVDGDTLTILSKDKAPLRNAKAEQRAERKLYETLKLQVGRRENLVDEEAVRFVTRLNHWDWPIDGTAHLDFRMLPELDASLEFSADNFAVQFKTWGMDGETEIHRSADPGDVFEAWKRGGYLVPLEGGGWAPIPEDWMQRFGSQVLDLLVARGDAEKLPTHAAPQVLDLCQDLGVEAPKTMERIRALATDFEGLPRAPHPDGLLATLRPYQEVGYRWLCFLRDAGLGALLADDMGLGKTLQALAAIKGRSLVVAPTSVLYNWQEEISRFRPDLEVCLFHGANRALDPKADIVLTSYTLMRSENELLCREEWSTLVLDEAQVIKNPGSQVSQAAYALRARSRFVLSGTPVENRLEELWSLFHFLNRGLLGSLEDFKERISVPIGEGSEMALSRLRKRIRPFVLRRLKGEVAPELPPRTDSVLRCDLSPEERNVYEAIRASTQKEVVSQLHLGGGVMKALEALLRLRQASCHSDLIPGQSASESAKLEILSDRLETLIQEGHKTLVFSQWTSYLDLIETRFKKEGFQYCRLDGSTRDRGAVVKEFQSKTGPPIMLISLKAGGTGLNLTEADHVFIMDPWWNPAVEEQAADRAHRIGQDKPVMVYKVVARDTVEEGILKLQLRKKALADSALGQSAGAGAISKNDLLELLS